MTEYRKPEIRPLAGNRIPRATQRFLGIIAHFAETNPAPAKVRIERDAWQILLTMLERVGTVRNGPLWGSFVGDLALVTEASHAGYLSDVLAEDNEVTLDPAYVLGWSDCVSTYGSNEVDWIGHWVILSSNQITNELALQESLLGATMSGILTERHFLVFVGVDAEQVKGRAYIMQGSPAEIDFEVI